MSSNNNQLVLQVGVRAFKTSNDGELIPLRWRTRKKWLTTCTSITLKLSCTHCMLKFLHSNALNTIGKVANGLNEPSARLSAPLGFVIAVLEACELIEGNFHGSCSQITNEWLNFISITSFGWNDCKIQRVLLPHSELYDAMSSRSSSSPTRYTAEVSLN